MDQHKGCSRKEMSMTWLIKSLLSQPPLRPAWQHEVDQYHENGGKARDLKWSESHDDPARDKLIRGLETGFWGDREYHLDMSARQDIVGVAMSLAMSTGVDGSFTQKERQSRTSVLQRLHQQASDDVAPSARLLACEYLGADPISINKRQLSRTRPNKTTR